MVPRIGLIGLSGGFKGHPIFLGGASIPLRFVCSSHTTQHGLRRIHVFGPCGAHYFTLLCPTTTSITVLHCHSKVKNKRTKCRPPSTSTSPPPFLLMNVSLLPKSRSIRFITVLSSSCPKFYSYKRLSTVRKKPHPSSSPNI